jgi:hypothetical protein
MAVGQVYGEAHGRVGIMRTLPRVICFVACTGLIITESVAARAATPRAIIKTRADEQNPAVAKGFITWGQNSRAHPNHYNVYARPSGKPKFKVNARGTIGWNGNGIDGTKLAYQQVRKGRSDIKFFDLTTKSRSNPPSGVNTPRWEWHPSVSGRWLLFGRNNFRTNRWSVILFDLQTGQGRTLDSIRKRKTNYIAAGDVSGNFAVWQRWAATDGDVFIYDIAAKSTRKVPDVRWEYAPSVSSGGSVFFGRSGSTCGAHAKLMRYRRGAGTKRLVRLPVHYDFGATDPITAGNGTTYVYYDPNRCFSNNQDIYRVTAPA